MAIKEVITLEGVQEVEAQLARLNASGEESLKKFRDLGSQATGGGFDKLVEGAQKAGFELENTSESTLKFNTVLKALKPVLNDVGLGVGNLGSVARLASQSLAAFGAVAAGGAIIGLGKLEENLARVQGELKDAFRGPGAGEKAFDALTNSAKEFGSSIGALAPGLLAFQRALANVDRTASGFVALKAEDLPFGKAPPQIQAVTDAYANFIKILRAGRLSQDEAEKSAAAFFNAMEEGGRVTLAALKALPVGTIDLLKQAFGAAGISNAQFFAAIDAGAISIDELTKRLAAFGPEAQKAFDTKAIKTMGDEVGRILTELNAGFAELTGKPFSDFVIGELERIRQGIRDTRSEWQRLQEIGQASFQASVGAAQQSLIEKLRGVPLPRPRPAEAEETQAILFKTDALSKNTRALQENLAAIRANIAAEREAIASKHTAIDMTVEETNAFHDALIDLRRKQDEQERSARKAADKKEEEEAAAESIKNIFKTAPDEAAQSGAAAGIAFGKGFVSAPIKEDISQATKEAGTEAGTSFSEGFKGIFGPQGFLPNLEELKTAFGGAGKDVGVDFSQAVQQTPPDFSSWIQAVTDFGSAAVNQAQQIYDQIKSIFAQPIEVRGQFTGFGGQAEGAPFAGGGKVRGRGTSTSDSNLAWLSNNEWVINARAVQHYGSALFSALNSMMLPRDFVSRFAMGGLVRAMSSGNRLAGGGQVNAAPFTLVLPDGMRLGGMTATDETVARLRRYAVKSQLSATGRKPSWVR